jgi:hypothetical protein
LEGRSYNFELYALGTVFKMLAGVYIFCLRLPNGDWYPLYVGETSNFKNRLSDCLRQHDCYAAAIKLGGTHVCVLQVPGVLALRENIETELRRSLRPPLNRQ